MARGQLRKAAATCRDGLRFARTPLERGGSPLLIIGYISAQLSLILREWNDLEAALTYAREGLEVCKRWGQTIYLSFAYGAMARMLQTMGDVDGAVDAIQQAKQVATDLPASAIALITAWEMEMRLAQGNAAAAWRWAQASGLSIDDEILFYRYQEYRTLARVLIVQGELGDALTLLRRLLEIAETAGAMGRVIQALVLQSIALQAQGQVDQALTALQRALVLAEPEGYVRVFIDKGAPMGELLQQAIVRGIVADYASMLLTALQAETEDEQLAFVAQPQVSAAEGLFDPLSEREIEVLRLLTTHLSRREIAGQLCISVNTARFHIKNIYSKLGAHSRSDAIHRAEELKLL